MDTTAGRFGYRPGLDGLRAVAVLAVLAYHDDRLGLPGGFLGVDVFFVLSGFLITSLLLVERERSGRIALRAFWVRRARRLLPAVLLMLGGVIAAVAVLGPESQRDGFGGDVVAALIYLSNWRLVFEGGSYFATFGPPDMLQHLWSLAIEEQFYLLWPIVALACLSRARPRAWLAGACLVGATASVAAMAVHAGGNADPSRAYFGTDTRAHTLLIGAGLALVARTPGPRASRFFARTGWVGLAGLALAFALVADTDRWMYRGGFALVAVAAAAVVAAAAGDGALARALGTRPLVAIGHISYALYLWHWPVDVVLTPERTGMSGLDLSVARAGVAFALAAASTRLVERPIRAGALVQWRAAAALGLATLVLASGALLVGQRGEPTVALPDDDSAFAEATEPAVSTPDPAPGDPDAGPEPRPVPDDGPGDDAADAAGGDGSAGDEPDTRSVGREPTRPVRVLVAGDSVALSVGVGLEEYDADGAFDLAGETILGCSLFRDGRVRLQGLVGEQPTQCPDWPTSWAARVGTHDPEVVVVLVGAWDVLDRDWDGTWRAPGDVTFDARYRSLVDEALDVLSARGAHVAVLTTPCFRQRDAAADRQFPEYEPARAAAVAAVQRAAALAHPAASVIDLHDLACPGGQFVDRFAGVDWRPDGVHFSLEGATRLGEWLTPQLLDLVPPATP